METKRDSSLQRPRAATSSRHDLERDRDHGCDCAVRIGSLCDIQRSVADATGVDFGGNGKSAFALSRGPRHGDHKG